MAIPDNIDLCPRLDIDIELLANLNIPLLGGLNLTAFLDIGSIPTSAEICPQILASFNASIAPFLPIFRLIDVGLCLFEIAEAIVDAIGPPPSPQTLIDAIVKCAISLDFILEFIPPLVVCPFVKAVLSLIIACFEDIIEQLGNILTVKLSIDAGKARSVALGGVILLDTNLSCAEDNLGLQLDAQGAAMDPMKTIIGVINIFMGLAGLDPIPIPEDLDLSVGIAGVEDLVEPLQDIVDALNVVLKSLPC